MIGRAVAGYVGTKTRITPRRPFDRNLSRVREIERLIRHRHAGGACDTADGDTWLEAAAPDLIQAQGQDAALKWARKWTPVLTIEAVLSTLDLAGARPPLKAGPLGQLLRLTSAERSTLGLKSIRAFDRTKRQMTEERKMKDRQYQRAKRQQAGAIPRERSLSATKPWEAEGISRATWDRRRKDRERAARNRVAAGATPRSQSLSATKPWEAEGISRRTWERRRAASVRDAMGEESSSASSVYIAADESSSSAASAHQPSSASAPVRGARLADGNGATGVRTILDEMAARRRTDAEILAERDRWIQAARARALAEDRPFLDVFREDAFARHLRDQAEFVAFVHRVSTGMLDGLVSADVMDAAATVPYSGEA